MFDHRYFGQPHGGLNQVYSKNEMVDLLITVYMFAIYSIQVLTNFSGVLCELVTNQSKCHFATAYGDCMDVICLTMLTNWHTVSDPMSDVIGTWLFHTTYYFCPGLIDVVESSNKYFF